MNSVSHFRESTFTAVSPGYYDSFKYGSLIDRMAPAAMGPQTLKFTPTYLDSAAFIKSNEALSRYVGVNFKVGGPMDAGAILSIKEPYLKLS